MIANRMKTCIAVLAAFPATCLPASTISSPEHKVGLQLSLGADGRIVTCAIAAPSDQPASDQSICNAMMANGFSRSGNSALSDRISTVLRWKGDGSHLDRSYQPDDVDLVLRPADGQPWLAIEDYPDEILSGKSQRIEIRYRVGPSGRVAECRAKDVKAAADLAEWTCKILKDRRVLPHRIDGAGKPIFYWTASVFEWAPRGVRVCDVQDACFRG